VRSVRWHDDTKRVLDVGDALFEYQRSDGEMIERRWRCDHAAPPPFALAVHDRPRITLQI
jgi:hypothetical protein